MDGRDAHLHPPDMLRASIKLRTADGRLFDVERRKGKGSKSLLFTESGKPVPQEVWTGILPVKEAELFGSMFGLDYESLIKGGQQLAEFKGEIGQTILAAAGDMGATAERIHRLQASANEIYGPQASARKLNKVIRAYKEADKVMRCERYTSAKYEDAVATQHELQRELSSISEELLQCAGNQIRLTRFHTAAPYVQRFHLDQIELTSLSNVIFLRPDFEKRWNDLTTAHSVGLSGKQHLQTELERLSVQVAAIQCQPQSASLLDSVNRLNLEAGKIKASRKDLPEAEATLRQLLIEQHNLCRNLGLEPTAVPQPTLHQRRRIQSLSKQHFGLQKTREELPARIAALQSRIRGIDGELALLPEDLDLSSVSQCLSQIPPRKQSGAETKHLKAACGELAGRLRLEMQSLPLWSGTIEQLETARVPLPASVGQMATRLTLQSGNETQLAKNEKILHSELNRCDRRFLHVDQHGNVPSAEQLAAARARRDLGWSAVKDQWLNGSVHGEAGIAFLSDSDIPLPAAFEASVAAADVAADRLRFEAERVEQRRTALDELDRAKQSLADHELAIHGARDQLQVLEAEWTGLWSEAGVQPRTLPEMDAWLEKRSGPLEQLRDLRRSEKQASEAEHEENQWRDARAAALDVSPSQSISELVAKGRQLLEHSSSVREKRAALSNRKTEAEANLQTELHSVEGNEKALELWKGHWQAMLHEVGLNESIDPSTVLEVMALIDDFSIKSAAMAQLSHRTQSMRQDDTDYSSAVKALALQAGCDKIAEKDALAAVKEIESLPRRHIATLETKREEGDRLLKGVRANGKSLALAELSDGTRDQLFLALRLAYIENHCAENAPCPVILDDVLMAFDDQRAGAALKVLQDLSKKTQVLIFTHHAHHIKLAENTLGTDGFRLHELTAEGSRG